MDNEKLLTEVKEKTDLIKKEMKKVIVGQDEVVNYLIISLFSGGHCLLMGVPGLAKTLMISTLAKLFHLSFKRIQFTPDLMPTDITGSEIIEENKSTGEKVFEFKKGPVFSNIVLADEINRTPPKTQSALLQAMQEKEVTAAGTNYSLPNPFFVLATQNPIEQEGTYPLPEAQLDRFMMNVVVQYPNEKEEQEIVKRTTGIEPGELTPVLKGEDILKIQHLIREIPAADFLIQRAVQLTRSTRPDNPQSPEIVKKYLSWGAGPRAALYLVLAAKTKALIEGNIAPGKDDIDAIAPEILRHRLITNFTADAEDITTDGIIQELIKLNK